MQGAFCVLNANAKSQTRKSMKINVICTVYIYIYIYIYICSVRGVKSTTQICLYNIYYHNNLSSRWPHYFPTRDLFPDILILNYMCTLLIKANVMVTHALATTTPAQTDITGGHYVRRYTIPSSTIGLPGNRAPDKAHRGSERTRTTRPQT